MEPTDWLGCFEYVLISHSSRTVSVIDWGWQLLETDAIGRYKTCCLAPSLQVNPLWHGSSRDSIFLTSPTCTFFLATDEHLHMLHLAPPHFLLQWLAFFLHSWLDDYHWLSSPGCPSLLSWRPVQGLASPGSSPESKRKMALPSADIPHLFLLSQQ